MSDIFRINAKHQRVHDELIAKAAMVIAEEMRDASMVRTRSNIGRVGERLRQIGADIIGHHQAWCSDMIEFQNHEDA